MLRFIPMSHKFLLIYHTPFYASYLLKKWGPLPYNVPHSGSG